jgi:hypothetical protein
MNRPFPLLLAALLSFAGPAAYADPSVPVKGRVFGLEYDGGPVKYVDASGDDKLFPVKINNRWGHMNQRGHLVVWPRFDWTDRSYQGLARAVIDGRTGFIKKDGDWYIEPRFIYADRFAQGYAIVGNGEKVGYINSAGKPLVPMELDGALRFRQGMAGVKIGKRCGFIDARGKLVIETRFAKVRSFHQGLAAVRGVVKGELGPWGYIDKTGNYRFRDTQGRIQTLGDFNENLARVEIRGRWGFINRGFKLQIEPRFQAARDFENGLAAVKQDGKWGYIDKAGQWRIKPQFDGADDFGSDFGNKLLTRIERDLHYGYVNTNASFGIRPQFEWARPFFRKRARVKQGPSFGYIDTKGRVIWDSRAPIQTGIADLTNRGQAAAKLDEHFPGTRTLELPPGQPSQPEPYPPEHQYDEVLPKPAE